jgi:Fur family peroxide stress response transcriptional regulator
MMASPPQSASTWSGDTELRTALEKSGLRFTRQRAAVYHYFRMVDAHPTAEDVYKAVRPLEPKISLATVYKALDALVEAGLLTKIATSDGPCRYDCRGEAHYHFYCLNTRQIVDLPTPYDPRLLDKLDPQLVSGLRRQGFEVTGYRLELLGIAQID